MNDAVTSLRERRLGAYRNEPTDIVEHFEGEEVERKNQINRPLIELLQNAEDAMGGFDLGERRRVLFRLDEAELLVANDGIPFSETGLAAVCARNLSPKQGKDFIGSKGVGFKAVLNWTDTPEIHSGEIHARFDRAQARNLVRTSVGDARLRELAAMRSWNQDNVPLLRLPLNASPNESVRNLQDAGYVTIIRLPIRPAVLSEVHQNLWDFDTRSLAFLWFIKNIEIETPGGHRRLVIYRNGSAVNVAESSSRGSIPDRSFSVYRQALPRVQPADPKDCGSAAVAIAVPHELIETDQRASTPLFNFFPTRREGPFRHLLIHGTFLLKGDRNDVEERDEDYHLKLVDALCELLGHKVIPEVTRKFGARALTALQPNREPAESDSIHARLRSKLVSYVKNTAFVSTIAGKTVAPSKSKLWEHGLSEFHSLGLTTDLWEVLPHAGWLECGRDTLLALDAKPLQPMEYVGAFSRWTIADPTSTAKAIKTLHQVYERIPSSDYRGLEEYAEAFRRKPLWLTRCNILRPLRGKTFFVAVPQDFPFEDSDWLEADFLHHDLSIALETGKDSGLWSRLSNLIGNCTTKYSRDEFLRRGLISSIRDKKDEWWQQHGSSVFRILTYLDLHAEDEYPWEPDTRADLAQAVFLPNNVGSWKPAWTLYAGQDWESDLGEVLGKGLPERGCLAPRGTLTELGIKSEALLRYLGVSWFPKVLASLDARELWSRDRLSECPFRGAGLAESWEAYAVELIERVREFDRATRGEVSCWTLRNACAFEGLDKALATRESHTDQLRLLRKLWSQLKPEQKRIGIHRTGPRGGRQRWFSDDEDHSFIRWQFANVVAIRPDQRAILASEREPLKAFFLEPPQQRRWMRWLPLLTIKAEREQEQRELEAFAMSLGVQGAVSKVGQQRWLAWLRAIGRNYAEELVEEQDLRSFLHDFANTLNDNLPDAEARALRLPARVAGGNVEFRPASEIYVLDDTSFDGLHDTLLKENLPLLLAELASGRKIARAFEIADRCLSQALRLQVLNTTPNPEATAQVQQVLNRKAPLLALVERTVGREVAVQLNEKWPTVHAVRPLIVRVLLDGRDLGEHLLPVHLTSPRKVLVDGESPLRNLARSVRYVLGRQEQLPEDTFVLYFERQLASDADTSTLAFLREKDVSAEAVDAWAQQCGEAAITPGDEVNTAKKNGIDLPKSPDHQQDQHTHSRATNQITENPREATENPAAPVLDGNGHRPTTLLLTQPSKAGVVRGADMRAARGREAEDWFLESIRCWLPPGWRQTGAGGGNAPFDAELTNGENSFFIEVKRDSGAFFWSQLEVEFAQAHQGRYAIALVGQEELLLDGGGTGRTLHWLFDPLGKCREWEISGRWNFGEVNHPTPVDPWFPPPLPQGISERSPSFRFRIAVPSTVELPAGVEPFRKILEFVE